MTGSLVPPNHAYDKRVPNKLHPTKQALIDTASRLLDDHRADEIQVDDVLSESGVSKGSLYHHFEDFGDLIETAMVQRFVVGSERDIAALKQIFSMATDKESLLASLEFVTESSQSESNRARRFERAAVLARSQGNPRLRAMLAEEQKRVNFEFSQLLRFGQSKGWFRQDLSADAAAIFIQAYTLGRLVDDVTEQPISPKVWNQLINQVLRLVFTN